ncbi:MAG TPA: 50S ribosomal protein L6 [Candidatus Dojkabacteria bacterium]|nr:50S ribosomal protein L6 [Candidatus Dojkabacteria bacterium]HQF36601.1 50S ribosomal protein L6 [Candidatus Dojkabacteria bacterium]
MSRIGVMPIQIPESVNVNIEGGSVKITGPKGETKFNVPKNITVKVDNNTILISRSGEDKLTKSLHGTVRATLANMIIGVVSGYQKVLKIEGIGYRSELNGNVLSLKVGKTHLIKIQCPEGLNVQVNDAVEIVISGVDKQLVGEFAAKVRANKKPEPYKGKGIRYSDEYVRRKTPKALSAA